MFTSPIRRAHNSLTRRSVSSSQQDGLALAGQARHGEPVPVMCVGFSAGVAGLDQQLDLLPPEGLHRGFLGHPRLRDLLHRVGHLEFHARPGEESRQADLEVVDRLVGEPSFFPAGNAARHVLAAQIVQKFKQVGRGDLPNILAHMLQPQLQVTRVIENCCL